jgi:hypothetical protein
MTPSPFLVEETPSLLHSVAEFMPILRPLFVYPHVHSVCEIGAEQGHLTSILANFVREGYLDFLTVVEPDVSEPVRALAEDLRVHLVNLPSPAALVDLRAHDLYIIDGDHNYHTVINELRLIHTANRNALILLHDVGWPCARRDHYYDPSRLPAYAVHPHTFDLAWMPNRAGVGEEGMRSRGAYAVALEEGGRENGVLTAVEDFLADWSTLRYLSLPFLFGLGVIFPSDHPLVPVLHEEVMPPRGCLDMLRRMEANRINTWLSLIEAQRALASIKNGGA